MLKRLLLTPIVALAAIIGFAVPAQAATVYAGAFTPTTGYHMWDYDGGLSIRCDAASLCGYTDNFTNFFQTHPGQWVSVCITARSVGDSATAGLSSDRLDRGLNFGVSNLFTTSCAYAYAYASGNPRVKIYGPGVIVRNVSIN